MRYFVLITILLISIFVSHAAKLDSLKKALEIAKSDTNKINMLMEICFLYEDKNIDSAISYSNKALDLAQKLNYPYGIANTNSRIGILEKNRGNYQQAMKNQKEALKYYSMILFQPGRAHTYNNIGVIYQNQGNYLKALESHFMALKINEQLKDKNNIAVTYNNIGVVYFKQNDYKKALTYYTMAKNVHLDMLPQNKKALANSLNNISTVFQAMKDYNQALTFALQSYELKKDYGNKRSQANSLGSIGNIYFFMKRYPEAISSHSQAMEIYKSVNDIKGQVTCFVNMAEVYLNSNQIDKAIELYKKGENLAKGIISPEVSMAVYEGLSKAYNQKGDFKNAYQYHVLLKKENDSIFNSNNTRKITELELNYEFDKKMREQEMLNKERQIIQQMEIKRQKTWRNFFIVAFILLLIPAAIILRNNIARKKANKLLAQQKENIENQSLLLKNAYEQLSEKNLQITDSINYARLIQDAILPSIKNIREFLPNTFLYYKPRDIVSGDFFWFNKVDDYIFLAVADCTGHGVPGSFLSIIGTTLLTDILREENEYSPAGILTRLNTNLNQILVQGGETREDGMDITLCRFELNKMHIQIASAGLSFYVHTPLGFKEFDGDIFSVGGLLSTRLDHEYFSTEFTATKGTTLYFLSDGIQDQFDQSNAKKLGSNRLKNMLQHCTGLNTEEKQCYIETELNTWRGSEKQTDDILLVSITV